MEHEKPKVRRQKVARAAPPNPVSAEAAGSKEVRTLDKLTRAAVGAREKIDALEEAVREIRRHTTKETYELRSMMLDLDRRLAELERGRPGGTSATSDVTARPATKPKRPAS